MNVDISQRIRRIYAAIDAVEESDPNQLRATVVQTNKIQAVIQDFRGGLSDEELTNSAHTLIHNIANLRDHLRKWAKENGTSPSMIDDIFDSSPSLKIIQDLSNNDKHGYPPRNSGFMGNCPRLPSIKRTMRLQTQGKKGSRIGMTLGADGTSEFFGDGTAKAVVTGDVVDKDNNRLGDLYEIINDAVKAVEHLLVDLRKDG